jgi:hypothetical protein
MCKKSKLSGNSKICQIFLWPVGSNPTKKNDVQKFLRLGQSLKLFKCVKSVN